MSTGQTPPVPQTPQGNTASQPQQGNPVDAQTKALLQMLMRAASQRRMTAQPTLAPVPGKLPPPQPMGNRPGYGVLEVLNGVRTGIHNAVAEKTQRDQIQGMNDWNYMESAFNELNAAKASGDQQATALAQKKLDTFFQDDKKLKQMSKALNQDWLNPEKTTAYAQGVQQAQKQSQTKQAQQQNARTKLMQLFRMNRQPQFQPNAQQRQDIGREIQSKAPMEMGGITPQVADAISKIQQQSETIDLRIQEQMNQEQWKEAQQTETQHYHDTQSQLGQLRLQIEQDKNASSDQKNKASQDIERQRLQEEERHNRAMETIAQGRQTKAQDTQTQAKIAAVDKWKDQQFSALEGKQLSGHKLAQAKKDIMDGYATQYKKLGQSPKADVGVMKIYLDAVGGDPQAAAKAAEQAGWQ